jgi:hypothetical protein
LYRNCPDDLHRYWPIRRARLATGALSLIAILFAGLTAFELTGSPTVCALAAALIGFLPQFTFRGATVNNDAAVASASALAMYFIVRLATRGLELRAAVYASVAVGLACLCKINAAAIMASLVLAIVAAPASPWLRLRMLATVIFVTGVVLSPWCLRNLMVYGDPVAKDVMVSTVPDMVGRQSITVPYFYTTFPELTWRSLIGYFGWMNVRLPESIYRGYLAATILAAVGLLVVWWQVPKSRPALAVLGIAPVMSLVVLLYFNLTFPQPQGRLLFPCLSAIAVLTATGIGAVPRIGRAIAYPLMILALGANIYAATKVILPAYWSVPSGMADLTMDAAVSDTAMKGRPPGPLIEGHEFVQTFTAEHDGLSAVEVEVAGYGRPIHTGTFRITMSDTTGEIARVRLPASMIPSFCIYARLQFPPIDGSRGKVYRIGLTTDDIPDGNAVTVFLSGNDVYPGGEFLVDGKASGQDTAFHAYYRPVSNSCLSCDSPSDRVQR